MSRYSPESRSTKGSQRWYRYTDLGAVPEEQGPYAWEHVHALTRLEAQQSHLACAVASYKKARVLTIELSKACRSPQYLLRASPTSSQNSTWFRGNESRDYTLRWIEGDARAKLLPTDEKPTSRTRNNEFSTQHTRHRLHAFQKLEQLTIPDITVRL
eukprot:1181474-Prorocentrum_minimum.AAC.1